MAIPTCSPRIPSQVAVAPGGKVWLIKNRIPASNQCQVDAASSSMVFKLWVARHKRRIIKKGLNFPPRIPSEWCIAA